MAIPQPGHKHAKGTSEGKNVRRPGDVVSKIMMDRAKTFRREAITLLALSKTRRTVLCGVYALQERVAIVCDFERKIVFTDVDNKNVMRPEIGMNAKLFLPRVGVLDFFVEEVQTVTPYVQELLH
jgi:hypothetical protein